MIKLAKKLAIAASVVAIFSGQFDASASNPWINQENNVASKQNKRPAPTQQQNEVEQDAVVGIQIYDADAGPIHFTPIKRDTYGGLVFRQYDRNLAICVTGNINTFTKPEGDNTRKALVLALPVSELMPIAQQISTDESFIQNVNRAGSSKTAVCALFRYGEDDIADRGFRYTILEYCEAAVLPLKELYVHEKMRAVGYGGEVAHNGMVLVGSFPVMNLN